MKSQPDIPKPVHSFIESEKAMTPNPFLATRVMAAISARKDTQRVGYRPVLSPVLAIASLVLVIWVGVEVGGSWVSPSRDAYPLVNDTQTENLSYYQQPETE